LGEQFPYGMFVAQDNDNTDAAGQPLFQNFKFVDWKPIAEALDLSIHIERDPRGRELDQPGELR